MSPLTSVKILISFVRVETALPERLLLSVWSHWVPGSWAEVLEGDLKGKLAQGLLSAWSLYTAPIATETARVRKQTGPF